MYFTIEFNRQLNNTPEINSSLAESDQNILQQIFLGNQLLAWIVDFFEGNQELFQAKEITLNYRDINEVMRELPYSDFMKNEIDYILNTLNNKINNSIFQKRSDNREQKFQIITAIKSLYYLLDDNFINNYINKANIDELKNIEPEQFMKMLYDNNLYGLIVDNKYNYYINNDEMKKSILDLLYFKTQQTQNDINNDNNNDINMNINMDIIKDDSNKMNISDIGGTKKNRKKNKKSKTINKNKNSNKNKTNKKNRTNKKRVKKLRSNTLKK
jgi:hypothetical protein